MAKKITVSSGGNLSAEQAAERVQEADRSGTQVHFGSNVPRRPGWGGTLEPTLLMGDTYTVTEEEEYSGNWEVPGTIQEPGMY
jgi:hypothetical protein